MSMKHNFAGWVTKNDILCSDGVTIKQDAFKHDDGSKVPLVWNHNHDSPNNILGHVKLVNREQGVYGYGFLNETREGLNAKEMINHGDIQAMSIFARNVRRRGTDVIHGKIHEVSLVLAGANPGALIDTVMAHSQGVEEQAVITTGLLIHASEDVLDEEETVNKKEEQEDMDDDKKIEHSDDGTDIASVVASMNENQLQALYALVGATAESNLETEEEEDLKQNVFNTQDKVENQDGVLIHSLNDALTYAKDNKASSLQDVLEHMAAEDETLSHGINSIEMLFPEATATNNEPHFIRNEGTAYQTILNGVKKSPFAKVKTIWADLTEDEARAKGYIKGNMKREEFFSLIKRETAPTTIYKKQAIDRDDIIDITDFNVVSFMTREMRFMLEEEIARAILVGDGRDVEDPDKVDETKIRPILKDNEFFTLQENYTGPLDFLETVLKAKRKYRGSGSPSLIIDPGLLVDIKLLKGEDGRYLNGHIMTNEEIKAATGVSQILESSWMEGKGAVLVNLADYQLGANKGGQITNFDDFDIDFNLYKYLAETRLSGSLTKPASAVHFVQSDDAPTRQTRAQAQMSYGDRQEDKEVEYPLGDD